MQNLHNYSTLITFSCKLDFGSSLSPYVGILCCAGLYLVPYIVTGLMVCIHFEQGFVLMPGCHTTMPQFLFFPEQ